MFEQSKQLPVRVYFLVQTNQGMLSVPLQSLFHLWLIGLLPLVGTTVTLTADTAQQEQHPLLFCTTAHTVAVSASLYSHAY